MYLVNAKQRGIGDEATEEDLKYFVAKYGAVIAGIKSVGEFFEFGDDPRMKGKIFTGCTSKDCFTFLLSYLEK